MRSTMILCVLVLVTGCGSRAAVSADLSVAGDSARRDGQPPPDKAIPSADVPAARCTSLSMTGQTLLEVADTMKFAPAVAFDGERFALVWHSQLAVISSMNGDLRFALVSSDSKTDTPDGIKLGSDNGILHAVISPSATHGGQYAVLNLQAQPEPCLTFSRIDAKGTALGGVCIKGQFYQAAMSSHPAGGEALFLAEQSGSPKLMVVDSPGTPPATKILGSAQVMSSLWLAPSSGGLAAAWSTTNSTGSLFLLDQAFGVLKQTVVGYGHTIKEPSFTVVPGGFAAVYTKSQEMGGEVELERYDPAATPLGHSTVATLGDYAATTGETALSWTGSQLAVTYSSPVSGMYSVRLVEPDGMPAGDAVQVPRCLATGRDVVTAWGKDRLAVVTIDEASGVMKSTVCVTQMACR
jgi:hypothetical protein